MVAKGCRDLDDWLELRDYLRADADAAARYAEVKRTMSERHYADRGSYVEAKTPIIEQLLAEARISK